MNWLSILIVAAIGGAAAFLGVLLARRVVPDTLKDARLLRQILVIGLIVLAVTAWLTLANPAIVDRSAFKREFGRAVGGFPAGQLYLSMKKYDPKSYDRLVEELAVSVGGGGTVTPEVQLEASKLATGYSARYYQNAQNQAVFDYLASYAGFLATRIDSAPLVVCQLENPQLYGSPGPAEFKAMEAAGVFLTLDAMIKSAMQEPVDFDQDRAAGLYRQFANDYRVRHPDGYATLSSKTTKAATGHIPQFARAYLDVYADLVALGPETGGVIYKYMRGAP